MERLLTLVAAFTLAVLVVGVFAGTPSAQTSPNGPAATTPKLNGNDPLVQDAKMYAAEYGVPLEEAVRRLRLQGPIGALDRELIMEERGTYAGLWIQHEPVYRVIARFTRDGERTIRPYAEGRPLEGLVEVLPAALLVAVSLVAAACGASPTTDDRAGDAATTTEHAAAPSTDREVFFPKQEPTDALFPSAAARGTLVMDEEGCLRRKHRSDERGDLLIWPHGYSLRTEGGEIQILDGKGQVLAQVGDRIEVGGGYVPRSLEGLKSVSERLQRKLPERCPGPYWLVSEMVRVDRRG